MMAARWLKMSIYEMRAGGIELEEWALTAITAENSANAEHVRKTEQKRRRKKK